MDAIDDKIIRDFTYVMQDIWYMRFVPLDILAKMYPDQNYSVTIIYWFQGLYII